MATNTSALKSFAQETRKKLISLISTKMDFILTQDTAELRGFESQITKLKSAIASKGKEHVVEEVAYTWFNRVMALRYMDANGYTDLKVVTPGVGQMRPEILQEAMAGNIDEDLRVKVDDNPKEAVLYRRLLVAVCNQYGTSMPFLFEHICDYTEMLLPDDLLSDQSFVTDIRNGMTDDDCQNVEVMGWLYQFYITDRKDDAEKKKSKKGGLKSDEQAAATQLFTPHWVVRYMVENSLGRIWMTLHPDSRLIDEMPYYIATPEGQTDTIPEDIHSVQDIRFIDPCMGSGHVLVYAFDLFCKMYEEEGYQSREIPALILQNNIYGLDIDRRCYQLASFALTMKGRAYHSRYLRKIVEPNVIALEKIDAETIESLSLNSDKGAASFFENADTIGSLVTIPNGLSESIVVEEGLWADIMSKTKIQSEFLERKYHCVVTNPPYLGKGIGDALRQYLNDHYPLSKADLMAAYMERCAEFSVPNGKFALINMQSWMLLDTYQYLRSFLIDSYVIDSLLQLGPHTFDEISGEIVQNAAFVMSNRMPNDNKGVYIMLSSGSNCKEKEDLFLNAKNSKANDIYFPDINQKDFRKLSGCPIIVGMSKKMLDCFDHLSAEHFCISKGQNITGDNDKYIRNFWEVDASNIQKDYWVLCARGGGFRKYYGNVVHTILWKPETREHYHKDKIARIVIEKLRFKTGITWSYVCSGKPTFRLLQDSELFEKAGTSVFVKDKTKVYSLLALLNSKVAFAIYGKLAPVTKLQVRDMFMLPIPDGVFATTTDEIALANIAIEKSDWDAHESSWDFKTNELYRLALGLTYDQVESSLMTNVGLNLSLEELVSRYTQFWQEKFMQLNTNEEELNRQFIKIYGLQDELTPNVPLDEITILQKGEISIEDNQIVWHKDVIIKQFISWMVGCFMGRYSADKPGLIIASQGQKVADLDLPAMTLEIDDDGIIPIIQEADFFADDMTQRIESGVKALFGEQNFYDNMKYIKACLGQELRDYLYKEYYDDHMQMYCVKGAKRPIYWLFSSKMGDKKKKGYFKALVYMHRIESDTLSKLHADYVSPYLDKIEQQKQEAEDDAVRDDLSQAQRNKANKLAAELADKVREVKEFATVLAQMSTQRLTIDLDDGVKTNYPKYYPLVEPIKGLESKDE